MSIKDFLRPFTPKFLLELNKRYSVDNMRKFEFDKTLDVKRDIEGKYQYTGDLLDLFATNKDFIVHKWHHYIPLYDCYFRRIGVAR